MIENFTIKISNGGVYRGNFKMIVISLLLSALIIYPVLGFSKLESYLAFFILFLIIYVIILSMSNENLSNELPTTLYPISPHLGLDGISLNNAMAGMSTAGIGI